MVQGEYSDYVQIPKDKMKALNSVGNLRHLLYSPLHLHPSHQMLIKCDHNDVLWLRCSLVKTLLKEWEEKAKVKQRSGDLFLSMSEFLFFTIVFLTVILTRSISKNQKPSKLRVGRVQGRYQRPCSRGCCQPGQHCRPRSEWSTDTHTGQRALFLSTGV